MRALSIRQPFAELILRGVKTVEYRSRPTRIVGERFYLYASKGSGVEVRGSGTELAGRIWSNDLAVPVAGRGERPPAWMLELAGRLIRGELPTGVIVGSAVIERCAPAEVDPPSGDAAGPGGALYAWHLADVERFAQPRRPTGHPQPVWFQPF
jgi:hypothetical protein